MRMRDIKEEYFNHIIRYSKNHAENRVDFGNSHGINIDEFIPENELLAMREENIELNREQVKTFWDIIEGTEVAIAKRSVRRNREEIEDRERQQEASKITGWENYQEQSS